MKHFSATGRLAALTIASAGAKKLHDDLDDLGLPMLAHGIKLVGEILANLVAAHVKANRGVEIEVVS